MFTPIFDSSQEPSDLISYAKWFIMNGLQFEIDMIEPNKWVAKTNMGNQKLETPISSGPSSAIQELHKIASAAIKNIKNV